MALQDFGLQENVVDLVFKKDCRMRKFYQAIDEHEGGTSDIHVIDSHVHFWKYDKVRDAWITNDMKVLQQDYVPATLASTLKRNGVDGGSCTGRPIGYETRF